MADKPAIGSFFANKSLLEMPVLSSRRKIETRLDYGVSSFDLIFSVKVLPNITWKIIYGKGGVALAVLASVQCYDWLSTFPDWVRRWSNVVIHLLIKLFCLLD